MDHKLKCLQYLTIITHPAKLLTKQSNPDYYSIQDGWGDPQCSSDNSQVVTSIQQQNKKTTYDSLLSIC